MNTKKSGSSSSRRGSRSSILTLTGIAALVCLVLAVTACGTGDGPRSQPEADQADADDSTTGESRTDADAAGDGATMDRQDRSDDGQLDDQLDDSGQADDPERGPDPTASNGESFPVGPVAWTDCETGLHCASVTVPLDHADPGGPTIDVALIRVPAGGRARGSIFVNLGGPGGSAVNSVRNGFRLDRQTMGDYHLVGFDPRGIGASTALACRIDLSDGPRPDFSPDTEEERQELDRQAEALARDCGRLDGALLPHLGTESVIRDLDLLRQAVGDDRLNYLGLSYGTVIGLRYAERYPTLVGRMVLDGVVDPSFGLTDLLRQQATEFERAFLVLDQACGPLLDCPEGGIVAGYDRLATLLEQRGPQGGVGTTELEVATLLAMYSEQLWPRYAAALTAAERGDFTAVEGLHDLYVRGIDFAAYIAVSCIDSRPPTGSQQWDRFVDELRVAAPRFGATLANEVRSCAHWPAGPVGEPAPVTASGAEPILVLSTTGDAATPLVNAANVASELEAAGLVIVQDEGHTAYGTSICAQQIVADYFDRGRVPEQIHRC